MVTSLGAVNRITAEIVTRITPENIEKGETTMQKSDNKYSLILICVNQGYTDRVMQTAKAAGATGGTVIRARLADAALLEQFVDNSIEEERDIISILVPNTICAPIMEQVNEQFGMNTEARGTLCAVPIEKAFKI